MWEGESLVVSCIPYSRRSRQTPDRLTFARILSKSHDSDDTRTSKVFQLPRVENPPSQLQVSRTMQDLTRTGNMAEAALWGLVSLYFFVRWCRARDDLQPVFRGLAIAFLVFGVSDLIEARTGAWWRPVWLLLLKGGCLIFLIAGFRKYSRIKKQMSAHVAPAKSPP